MEASNVNKIDLIIENKRVSLGTKNETAAASDKKPRQAKLANDQTPQMVDHAKLDDIAESLNNYLKSIQTDLQVEIHRETHTAIFKVVKRDGKEVISEVPPSKLLEIEAKVKEMIGALLDATA